ncbi:MAG: serine/threonine protein phosphatase [Novosphingobium sp.]|nr:serine/threonine protein phosphatase [Novosphingobium sp.]
MLQSLRNLVRPRANPPPAIPPGERVYAIGDIHGRLDLFLAMIEAVETDDRARGHADSTVILLGDLVDRGPQSAQVLVAARAWQAERKVRILRGNHEVMFLDSLGKETAFRHFLKVGGRETVLSYPVNPASFARADPAGMHDLFRRAVPEEDLAFIASFEELVRIGDYLFVHAGILPGVPFAQQDPMDLHWIREPFLSHTGDHGAIVVHGHTITAEADIRPNRIGLDTGAFMSGRLTALGLAGKERWLIEASERDGGISTTVRPL